MLHPHTPPCQSGGGELNLGTRRYLRRRRQLSLLCCAPFSRVFMPRASSYHPTNSRRMTCPPPCVTRRYSIPRSSWTKRPGCFSVASTNVAISGVESLSAIFSAPTSCPVHLNVDYPGMVFISQEPTVCVVEDFLEATQCAALIECARPLVRASGTAFGGAARCSECSDQQHRAAQARSKRSCSPSRENCQAITKTCRALRGSTGIALPQW